MLTTNASNMADAVAYLIKVARHAGMRRIATKLGSVRSELLDLAREEVGEVESDRIVSVPPDQH